MKTTIHTCKECGANYRTTSPSEDVRDCIGYEGQYGVTRDGRIWSYKSKGRWLKTPPNEGGYPHAALYYKRNRHRIVLVHRVVAMAYLGPPPFDGAVINHKNGVITDNRVENLEWCSQKENVHHAWRTGLATAYQRS